MSQVSQFQFKVQVTVDKEVFLVGITDPHLTVAWLANHVAERYFTETGTRVILRIRDSDGAKLLPGDLLGNVLANGDKLTTEVNVTDEAEQTLRENQGSEGGLVLWSMLVMGVNLLYFVLKTMLGQSYFTIDIVISAVLYSFCFQVMMDMSQGGHDFKLPGGGGVKVC